jgi:hypothetical protein
VIWETWRSSHPRARAISKQPVTSFAVRLRIRHVSGAVFAKKSDRLVKTSGASKLSGSRFGGSSLSHLDVSFKHATNSIALTT